MAVTRITDAWLTAEHKPLPSKRAPRWCAATKAVNEDPAIVNRASPRTIRMLGWLAAGLLTSQPVCLPALATLGEDATKVENARIRMKAQLRTTAITGYTLLRI